MRDDKNSAGRVLVARSGGFARTVGVSFFVGGLLLGGLALWGTIVPGQTYFTESTDVGWPDGDVASLHSIDAIVDFVRNTSPADDHDVVRTIYDTVRRRFDRCTPFLTPQQNWILWGVSLIWPLRGAPTAPLLPKYSRCGLCDQVNGVFVLVATVFNIPARLVSMPGHTTAEAYWNGAWRVVDPHFDYFPDPLAPAVVAETLGQNPHWVQMAYAHLEQRTVVATVNSYVRFVSGDGVRRETGQLNSPRLAVIQRWAEIGKFVIPILFLTTGIAILRLRIGKKTAD
ncbi:MAG: hypothetical protein HUU55_04885 [Myxococcales bacterium]|nr:hypothetical protein [Myxococcales bacterium]